MKNLKFLVLATFFTIVLFPHSSFAATPTLSLNPLGNNSVQFTVNGDPNSSINLFYTPPGGSSILAGNIGNTNSSGYFTTTIYNGTYNIPSGSNTYVVVNSQQSNTVQWPYNNGNGGQITFSQNNINLSYGQSTTVTIYGGSGSYYISSNSNSNYINATIGGNQLYLSQPSSQYVGGSATIVVCSNGNGSCGTLYVSQNGNGNGGQISFSQSNVSVNIGQGIQVSVYGSGSFYVSNNSNPNAVATNINGSVLNIYGSQYGSATLAVCSSGGNSSCGTLYVNVSNSGYYNPYNNNNQPIVYTQNPILPTYYQGGYSGTPSAGVFLNQVPSTGINANLKTTLFFIGLLLWSAFGAFMILSHRKYQRILTENI